MKDKVINAKEYVTQKKYEKAIEKYEWIIEHCIDYKSKDIERESLKTLFTLYNLTSDRINANKCAKQLFRLYGETVSN